MNRQNYLDFHKKFCQQMIDVTQKKNNDYSGNSDDPFFNFTRANILGICSVEQGFLTRMTDKLARLITFSKKQTLLVKDENIEDTLLDLANYCVLMAGYITSQRNKNV